MPNPEEHFSRYCDQVCAHVRFRPDHAAIRAELMAHLEDRYRAILDRQPNLPLFEAGDRAAAAMGDPAELGRALDAIHTPALGWAQIAARALVCAVVALIAVFSLFSLDGTRRFFSMFESDPLCEEPAQTSGDDVPLCSRPDVSVHVRGYTFTVEQAVLTDESAGNFVGSALLCSLSAASSDPGARHPEFSLWLYALDDLGNRYDSLGERLLDAPATSRSVSVGTESAGPFLSRYQVYIGGIPPEAAEITLIFDRYGKNEIYLTIPLRGGESDG